MPIFNTTYPFQASDFSFTARTIQTSGATTGFAWVFVCPASFASTDTFHIDFSISSNGNSGSQNVAARLYALDGSGNWNSASPLSSQANLANNTTNFPANGVAQMDITLTSALTKGNRYACRIFPNTTFTAGLGINAVIATNYPYTSNSDEYHINGVTIAAAYPNFAIGTATTIVGRRCIRRLPQTSTATTAVASQVGFSFTLPSGASYTLNYVSVKGLTLDTAGGTTGTATPRILNQAGSSTIASGTAISHGDIRVATSTSTNYTFYFPSGVSLTGGTGYIFVIENSTAKQLQFVEIENSFDTVATFDGEVTGLDVIRRNGTSGAFTSESLAGSYQALPIASLDVDVVASSAGLATNPLVGYIL
jgi:hypothetical protein